MPRRAGILFVSIDGTRIDVKGDWSYNLGRNKAEAIVGMDGIHDYKEKPQVAWVEGEMTDRADLDLDTILNARNATVTLQLANGKTIVFNNAWYAGDGDVGVEEANVQIRFEANKAQEIAA